MKTALMASVSALTLLPGAALAQEACGNSYMILPDGSCLNMSYLTVLGSTSREVAAAQSDYSSLYRANLSLDSDVFYRAAESDAERDERLSRLAERGLELDDTRNTANSIENRLYPLHMEAMMRVSDAYQPRFARR